MWYSSPSRNTYYLKNIYIVLKLTLRMNCISLPLLALKILFYLFRRLSKRWKKGCYVNSSKNIKWALACVAQRLQYWPKDWSVSVLILLKGTSLSCRFHHGPYGLFERQPIYGVPFMCVSLSLPSTLSRNQWKKYSPVGINKQTKNPGDLLSNF